MMQCDHHKDKWTSSRASEPVSLFGITHDGACTPEIKSRVSMTTNAFNKRRELFSIRMSKDLKKKIIKTIFWSAALYGSETWSLKSTREKDRLEAFEMWTWRNMENISWKDQNTTEYVLGLAKEKRKLSKTLY